MLPPLNTNKSCRVFLLAGAVSLGVMSPAFPAPAQTDDPLAPASEAARRKRDPSQLESLKSQLVKRASQNPQGRLESISARPGRKLSGGCRRIAQRQKAAIAALRQSHRSRPAGDSARRQIRRCSQPGRRSVWPENWAGRWHVPRTKVRTQSWRRKQTRHGPRRQESPRLGEHRPSISDGSQSLRRRHPESDRQLQKVSSP
jgi:hypothetical protein